MSGLFDFKVAVQLATSEPPFDALIMAACIRADGGSLPKLRAAFPELLAEATQRYRSPGGKLATDGATT